MFKPIYPIKKYVGDTSIAYDDGLHVLYVNGSYKDKPSEPTPLGKLIHDFNCIDADDMNYPVLADRVRYLKEDDKGVDKMSKIVEDFVNAEVKEEKKEIARSFIKDGLVPLDVIAQKFGFSLEEVEELRQEA